MSSTVAAIAGIPASVISHDTAVRPFEKEFEQIALHGLGWPKKQCGPQQRRRSIIPQEEAIRVSYYTDSETDLQMSIIALNRGMTTDELYRSIASAFVAAYHSR